MVTKSRIAEHPKFAAILNAYNEILKREGRVNNSKFFREFILPEMPDAKYDAWYALVTRFKTAAGLPENLIPIGPNGGIVKLNEEIMEEVQRTFLTNDQATQQGITTALNLGSAFYADLYKKYNTDPNSLTPFENKVLADALHKAMKSQDSRIHAIKSIKEDGREQARFDHAFKTAGMDE